MNRDADFEELEIYQLARTIRKKFYHLARQLPEEEKHLLKPQIFDAARSLTNNIAEARGRYYSRSQARAIRNSMGSLNGLIADANICLDESYLDEKHLSDLKAECYDLRKKLKEYTSSLRRTQLQDEAFEWNQVKKAKRPKNGGRDSFAFAPLRRLLLS